MALINHTRMLWFAVCFIFCTSFTPALAINTNQDLWPDYKNVTERNQLYSNTFSTQIPVPYFDIITDVISIHMNGYVTFGAEYDGKVPPPTEWPFAPKILAVYWTNQENFLPNPLTLYTYDDYSRLYNVTRQSSLIKYVKQVVNQSEFEPLTVCAVTWEGVRPKLKDRYPNDTATFQVVIATDSRVTYAIRNYQSVWESPELANQTYYSAVYSQGNGARPKITIPGNHTGPEVIQLGTKKPNKDAFNCVEKANAARINLNSSFYSLPACPCYQLQAARDQQFTVSTSFPACHQSRTPPQGGSLLQLCCYNQHGILVNLTKEARVPVSADPNDRSLQEAYDSCCAPGSALCRWFYIHLHKSICVNNMTLLNTNELPQFIASTSTITMKASPTNSITFVRTFTSNIKPVTYNVSTIFNSSHGFTLENSGYRWDLGKGLRELRKLPYPQQLVFYLTDVNDISVAYAPLVEMCLCEQVDQCKSVSFPVRIDYTPYEFRGYVGLDTYEKGNVNMILCQCNANSTGRYCEKPVNACDNCLIQQKSVCDFNPQDYCPSCPYGYEREGTQCRDEKSITNGSGNSIYSITSAHVVLFIILSFISSSSIPWLQNSLTNHL